MTRPLHIAFFGSDKFSVVSLQKLLALPHKISVVTRSKKPTGRRGKILSDTAIGDFASKCNVALFRADSSADIVALPEKFDLAVAVSYGKLIPATFIQNLRFGGLNVHPSLLPRYSGSSPIQYALMNNDPTTGVSVQTLHPTKFDAGDILAQSDEIAIEKSDNYASLEGKLAEKGADLLAGVIEQKLFEPPLNPILSNYTYSLAPKITKSQTQVDWNKPSVMVQRLYDALGPVHTFLGDLRVILLGVRQEEGSYPLSNPGDFMLNDEKLVVKTADGFVSVEKLKPQYCGEESAVVFVERLLKRGGVSSFR